jgi:hypothetical protein
MWRQAPISAAFVISAGLEYHSRKHGLIAGVGRMSEVLFGCLVGLSIRNWVLASYIVTDQNAFTGGSCRDQPREGRQATRFPLS